MMPEAILDTPVAPGTATALLMPEFGELIKAASGNVRPAYTRHRMGEVANRMGYVQQGILVDQTPHIPDRWKRDFARHNLAVRAILNTIIPDVARHFARPENERAVGAVIRQKERNRPLTPNGAKLRDYIAGILFNGGIRTEHEDTGEVAVWDGHYETRADTLQMAVSRILEDTFVLDRVFLSTEGSSDNRRTHPVMYWKVEDGSLAYFSEPKQYQPQLRDDLKKIRDDGPSLVRYVMTDPGMPGANTMMREFAWNEGYLAVRNPRTEFLAYGYGYPEVEQCVDALLGVLDGIAINKAWHQKNHIPSGFLNLIGDYTENEVRAMKVRILQELMGPDNAFKLLTLVTKPGTGNGVQYIPAVDRTHMGMISEPFITLCVAFASAVWGVPPEAFGFASFGGPQQTLNPDNPEAVLNNGKYRCQLPLVLWLCEVFNRAIVSQISDHFELAIQGLEARYNPEYLAEVQLDIQRMGAGYTMNQIAAIRDEPRFYDPLDIDLWRKIEKSHQDRPYADQSQRVEAIAEEYERKGGKLGSYPDAPGGNPSLLQLWMQDHQGEQQEAQQMMGSMAQNDYQQQMEQEGAQQEDARQQMAQFGQQANEADLQQQAQQQQAQQGRPMPVRKAVGGGRTVITIEKGD